jgi:hydrogenase maturation factor HypF (carbamoyltransferase family)
VLAPARVNLDGVAPENPELGIMLPYAPGAVASLATDRPILALGADLKNTVTLVVGGQAFVGPHIGDLDHFDVYQAFQETVRDLCHLYEVALDDALIVHDAHPEYLSTRHAQELGGEVLAIQHHRAHVASVLAERGAWDTRVVGVAFDGTGYGDDGSIWCAKACGLSPRRRRAGCSTPWPRWWGLPARSRSKGRPRCGSSIAPGGARL